MTNLLSRIAVALVLLPLVLGLVYLGGWWLFAVAAVAAVLALHELYTMCKPLRPLVPAGILGAVAALLGAQLGGVDWMVGGFVATLALAFLLSGIAETRQAATVTVGTTVLGAAWVGLGLGFVILLRDIPEHGRLAIFTVLLAVFAGDTAAFFVGRFIGRHKLAPVVSPGKTWEGFVAGVLATVALCFFALYDEGFLDDWRSLVFGLVIAAAAPVGDLFESAIKRDMRVKDSGRVLGGHGGMLDRLDAHLFAAPAAYFAVLALAQ